MEVINSNYCVILDCYIENSCQHKNVIMVKSDLKVTDLDFFSPVHLWPLKWVSESAYERWLLIAG